MKKIHLISLLTILLLMLCSCSGSPEIMSEVNLSDYLKLGTYKGLIYTKIDTEPSDYKVQLALNSMLYDAGYGNPSDDKIENGTVQVGDTINLNYSGKKDGVAFDGGTAENQSLTIGSNQFIDGFEEGLVGVKIGDTVKLNLTFPNDYHKSSLAGQDVVFTVKVNFVSNRTHYPKLTDALAQELNKEAKTKEDLMKLIKDELTAKNEQQMERTRQNQIWSQVMSNTSFKETLPEKNLEKVRQQYTDYYTTLALQNNFDTLDAFLSANRMSQSDLDAMAESMIKQQLVSYAIAEAEGYTVSETEFQKVANEFAAASGIADVNEYIERVGRNNIEDQIVVDFAYNLMLKNAIAE